MERIRVGRQTEQQRCPLCLDAIGDAEADEKRCDGCQTLYHASCLRELGGCSTLGCSHQRGHSRAATARAAPLDVTWARGEEVGENWRTEMQREADRRGVFWTSLFATSLAALGGAAWEISNFDQSTIAGAIIASAICFFVSILTGIQASQCTSTDTRLGRFWHAVKLGLRMLGVLTLFVCFTFAPLAVLIFGPNQRRGTTLAYLAFAAFGLVVTLITFSKVRDLD